MLIEQIFGSRGPGPPGRICTPITGCFHDKTLISKENIRVECYLQLKYCRSRHGHDLDLPRSDRDLEDQDRNLILIFNITLF